GIVDNNWNERVIKTTLARNSGEFDCVVLGSSHIMQISSIRNTGNIQQQCKNLLNLGVSGGSLEDLAIFSFIILNNPNLPKKVFIDIDPWTFKFGMDSRYGAYQFYYNEMNKILEEENNNKDKASYWSKIGKNIFNFQYFYYSLLTLTNNNDKTTTPSSLLSKNILYPLTSYDYTNGYIYPIILQDGSRVYAKDFILSHKNSNPFITATDKDANYKISGEIYDPNALKYFEKIISLYKKNGIDVKFIFTPYHPVLFKAGNIKPVTHMTEIEKITKNLTKSYNIKTYGSYSPEKVGCKNDDFFDAMHPTTPCLNKIKFSE
ncbi:hypothetical protein, partial [Sulfuricurvum sp. PD_MW2]|uniref:hypothetical protein n=1 Tax=Sulfuricurvum sp. PD_MW2 TaxID=2027917 RepID=UPI0025F96B5C